MCITENDACGVDGIQALLGCTAGKGNLLWHITGKMAFSFYERNSGRACRMVLIAQQGSRSREDYQRYLLEGPAQEIFTIEKPRFPLPAKAPHYDSCRCEICSEWTAEPYYSVTKGKESMHRLLPGRKSQPIRREKEDEDKNEKRNRSAGGRMFVPDEC